MKNKKAGIITGLFILMFFVSIGKNFAHLTVTYPWLDQKEIYEYTQKESLLEICIISISMMIVPFLCRIIKKKKLPYKSGKILCILNSIILFLILIALQVRMNTPSVGVIGAIIYYFINKWIFVEEPQVTLNEENKEDKQDNDEENQADEKS